MCPPSTRNPGNHAPSTLGQLRKRPDSDTDTFQISMRMKQRKRLAPEAKQLVGNFLKHKKKLKTAVCSVHGRRTRFSSLFAFKNYIHCDHNILCTKQFKLFFPHPCFLWANDLAISDFTNWCTFQGGNKSDFGEGLVYCDKSNVKSYHLHSLPG